MTDGRDTSTAPAARAARGRAAGPDPASPDPAGPDPAGPDPAGPNPAAQAGDPPELAERVRALIEPLRAEPGALLPVLHAVQAEFGYVPAGAVPVIAGELNLSRADVHGVLTFYRDFRTAPAGETVLRICRAEACQARGGDELLAEAQRELRIGIGETTQDGRLTLDEVFCLGNCALGPAVQVERGHRQRVYGRPDLHRLPELIAAARSGPGLLPGEPALPGRSPLPEQAPPADRPAQPAGLATDPHASGTAAVTICVPADTAARSIGADEVAARLAAAAAPAGVRLDLVRTGSRGALWLEPLVEVTAADGIRWGFGPVSPDDVDGLVAAGLLTAPPEQVSHPLALGPVEQLRWLHDQTRVTCARLGVVDPRSAEDYRRHGGMAGLRRALAMPPAEVIAELIASGLRGRGGAGFPAGVKWRTVAQTPAPVRYVVCNADEGDSGTFVDRMLLEGDPFSTIEGMLIAAHAVGASEGFVYLRSEYPDAIASLEHAVVAARELGWLGPDALGAGRGFELRVRVGAGAYICGEETSMLESIEGRRAQVRAKPPLPAVSGLFGAPTVVNNLLTLATVPAVLADGAEAYQVLGTGRSRGTQVFQLAGNVARGGLVELPFGVRLGELVGPDGWGAGTWSGRPVRAVQVGGPLGAYLPASAFDLSMDYETLAGADAMLGHGGLVVFDDTVDLAAQARFAMEFCAAESCGKCTPCRIGAVRGVEVLDRIIAGVDRDANLALLDDLCELMTDGSLCAMGGLTPVPVRSAVRHFRSDFGKRSDVGKEVTA